jgi:hypothetical protein
MPGKSKKGGGLEVGSAYKMKYQGNHSAFPFKESAKRFHGAFYNPNIHDQGEYVPEHSHSEDGQGIVATVKNPQGTQTSLGTSGIGSIIGGGIGRRTSEGQL